MEDETMIRRCLGYDSSGPDRSIKWRPRCSVISVATNRYRLPDCIVIDWKRTIQLLKEILR